mmetsp:Transcript_36534/g.87128  ORF Transcript_36534/g.87128 Transcript_36534/m.87128 type:complete len:229 (+) Transcript_36534:2044-2730(+)
MSLQGMAVVFWSQTDTSSRSSETCLDHARAQDSRHDCSEALLSNDTMVEAKTFMAALLIGFSGHSIEYARIQFSNTNLVLSARSSMNVAEISGDASARTSVSSQPESKADLMFRWNSTSNTNEREVRMMARCQGSRGDVPGPDSDADSDDELMSAGSVHELRMSFTKCWNSSASRRDCQLWIEFDFWTSGRNTSNPFDTVHFTAESSDTVLSFSSSSPSLNSRGLTFS